MTILKLTIVFGVVVYVILLVAAFSQGSALGPILVVPLALAIMVGGLNWMSSYMGLPVRRQKFRRRDDDHT